MARPEIEKKKKDKKLQSRAKNKEEKQEKSRKQSYIKGICSIVLSFLAISR